jgi:hypothetical protein
MFFCGFETVIFVTDWNSVVASFTGNKNKTLFSNSLLFSRVQNIWFYSAFPAVFPFHRPYAKCMVSGFIVNTAWRFLKLQLKEMAVSAMEISSKFLARWSSL